MSHKPSSKPHITLLGKFPPVIGGIETHVRDLAFGFAQRAKIDVVAPNQVNQTVEERLTENLSIQRLASHGIFYSLPLCLKGIHSTRRLRSDLMHLHSPNPIFELSIMRFRPKIPLIVTHHSDVVRQKVLSPWYRQLYRRVLDRADAIIVSSQNYLDHSRALRGFESKVLVIPLGVKDPECSQTCEKKRPSFLKELLGNQPFVLSVGRLVSYKGFDFLLDAAKHHGLHTVIVGEGKLKSKLQRKIRQNGLAKKITLVGQVSDQMLQAFYHHCHVFVMSSTSKNEAFGLVQIEAMAHNRPVVVTDIPGSGITSIPSEGETGFIVPIRNPEALGLAIHQLEKDPLLARSMGVSGRNRFLQNFERTLCLEKVWSLYETVWSQQRRRRGEDVVSVDRYAQAGVNTL